MAEPAKSSSSRAEALAFAEAGLAGSWAGPLPRALPDETDLEAADGVFDGPAAYIEGSMDDDKLSALLVGVAGGLAVLSKLKSEAWGAK